MSPRGEPWGMSTLDKMPQGVVLTWRLEDVIGDVGRGRGTTGLAFSRFWGLIWFGQVGGLCINKWLGWR